MAEKAEIRLHDDRVLRVGLQDYKGAEYIGVRVWERFEDGADFRPTKKGITIRLDKGLELLAALSAILEPVADAEAGDLEG